MVFCAGDKEWKGRYIEVFETKYQNNDKERGALYIFRGHIDLVAIYQHIFGSDELVLRTCD